MSFQVSVSNAKDNIGGIWSLERLEKGRKRVVHKIGVLVGYTWYVP